MATFNTARQILKSMVITIIFTSCTFNIPGIYVAKDNKNRIDSLFLYKNGSFMQKITDKKNNKTLYQHNGNWQEGHNFDIVFTSIFLDGDSLYYNLKHVQEYERSNIHFEMTRHYGYNTIYWSEYIDLPETYHYYYKIKDYE